MIRYTNLYSKFKDLISNSVDFMQEESHSIFMKSCAIFASAAAVFCMATIIPANANESKSSFNTASESKNKSEKKFTEKGVIVTAFQQNWKSIAKECKETYGPEGVSYVQVSPPQDHIKGNAWWTSYQPVSYKLDSKLGTEAEFKNMITTCKAKKVGIIVDAVINHMTGDGNKDTVGVGGSKYDAASQTFEDAGYTKDDFHQIAKNIGNYRDPEEVWNYRLVGLLDLDTSKPHVQQVLGGYFAKLLKMGVAGFRIDAAKHMEPKDVKAIKQAASDLSGIAYDKIWWMQETIGDIDGAKETQPDQYYGTGEVDEFEYSHRLRNYFYGSIENLKHITDNLTPNDKAAIFVTNWDTERDSSTRVLTYKDGAKYSLANAFMLAYPYGTPNIYSGYKFTQRDESAPGATDTSVPDVKCGKNSQWQCTQRLTYIRGMVGFYNAVKGTKVTQWQDDNDNNVAFSRGDKGFLAINNTDKPKKVSYKTDLPDGEYCNVYVSSKCGSKVTVNSGKIETTIPANSAIALHVKAVDHFGSTSVLTTVLMIVVVFVVLLIELVLILCKNKADSNKKLDSGKN